MISDGDSPYLDLFPEIFKLFALGDILLVGNFNVRTCIAQCFVFDNPSDSLCLKELNHDNLGVFLVAQLMQTILSHPMVST